MSSAEQLLAEAQAWIAGDPDPVTRAELTELVAARELTQLASRLTPLAFGTAGLRGAVGAGPGRMNLAVVIRAAAGIARYVAEAGHGDLVVLGFDARPTSRAFAEASAGVLLAAGLRVAAAFEPIPTPLCAFFGRELGAAATIVVTASHNPRGDNGYKVYGPLAVQITTPLDDVIARHIAAAPAAAHVPRRELRFPAEVPGLSWLSPERQKAYFDALAAALPPTALARDLRIVHSALHGVGSAPMLRALAEAGFTDVTSVVEQAEPDGSFPTTPFPNPEEPGTLDLALSTAEQRGAALLLVNDPDADRLSAAARLDGALTVLDGNQLGALLMDACLERARVASRALVLSSVVSSPLVEQVCRARGARYERTHTGFKWLWTAALALERAENLEFCGAYEEALGYSVLPAVRDKDGISAGRALAELAAAQAAQGRTLYDRLFELYRQHGLWASGAQNLALSGPDASARLGASLAALSSGVSSVLAGERVTSVLDYRQSDGARPPWLGAAPLVELTLESGARLLVRPSGTEPKLKLYGHVRRELTQRAELAPALAQARARAAELLAALAVRLA